MNSIHSTTRRRSGAATLELILVLPVLLLITIGLIEFGVMFANLQQVALASRVGVERASELATLPAMTSGDPVPPEVIEAIEQQLQSSCIEWCHIRLEHTAADPQAQEVLESMQGDPCGCEEFVPLPADEIPTGRYVRLTLTVPLSEVVPSGLTLFGCRLFSAEQAFHSTTIFRYEIGTP
jgi:TadE-like protein